MEYALITGASSGIGAALSLKLAKEGYNLILTGRDTARLDRLRIIIEEVYEVNILTYKVDLLYEDEIEAFVNKLKIINLSITLFVNNAGLGTFGKFDEMSAEDDLNVIDVNILASTLLLKRLIPLMPPNSKILQVASTAGFVPGPYMAVYYASKAYVISLSLALGEELRYNKIQVSVLCPGTTKTNFQKRSDIKKSSLANIFVMSPTKVATIAYNGLINNKKIIITGTCNKHIMNIMRIIPCSYKAKLVAKTQNYK